MVSPASLVHDVLAVTGMQKMMILPACNFSYPHAHCCLPSCADGCRMIVGGHIGTLTCDLGIAAVTIINIFSFASNPPTTASSYTEQRDFQGALRTALLSCGFTVVLFGVNVAGFRNVLLGVQTAVQRVSIQASNRVRSRASPRVQSNRGSQQLPLPSCDAHAPSCQVMPLPEVALLICVDLLVCPLPKLDRLDVGCHDGTLYESR